MLSRLAVALIVLGVVLIIVDLFAAAALAGPGIGLVVLGVLLLLVEYVLASRRPGPR